MIVTFVGYLYIYFSNVLIFFMYSFYFTNVLIFFFVLYSLYIYIQKKKVNHKVYQINNNN